MVLRGGEPGGCLTGFWMHFPETRHFGDECVRAHVEYYNATDVDILKVMNEHPYKIGCAIEKPEDWRYLRPHRAKEYYAGYLEELRKTRRTVGPDVPLLATIHGVLVSACHATDGMGKFTDPDNTVTSRTGGCSADARRLVRRVCRRGRGWHLLCGAGRRGISF